VKPSGWRHSLGFKRGYLKGRDQLLLREMLPASAGETSRRYLKGRKEKGEATGEDVQRGASEGQVKSHPGRGTMGT